MRTSCVSGLPARSILWGAWFPSLIESQLQLRRFPRAVCAAVRTRAEAIFLAQPFHSRGDFLAIAVGRIPVALVPRAILPRKLRKFRIQERQKMFQRSRHQEQHIPREPL